MLFRVKRTQKEELALLMYSLDMTRTYEEMLNNYEWFSLACGIRDEEKTLKLMKEILKEGLYGIIKDLRVERER